MAEKRKKQTAVFGTNQPRDENRAFGHDVQRSEQKQKSGKNKRKTGQYRKEDTFGPVSYTHLTLPTTSRV